MTTTPLTLGDFDDSIESIESRTHEMIGMINAHDERQTREVTLDDLWEMVDQLHAATQRMIARRDERAGRRD